MELSEIRDKLLTLGIPVAYLHFKTEQTPPYAVYFESNTEIRGADAYNLYRDVEITVELYSPKKNPQLERRLENLFRDVEIDKAGDTVLEGENLIMTVFTFNTIQSIEEDENNA
ncbi:MAG: hypothetical protein K6G82_07525 [Ruminococcus sp.]|nr:hypothetical protein [Ruminococcus sp.]